MSFQVLARKYRPSTFSEVVGQEHILRALENSIKHNKLHQAYIFSGTRGVGKTTIARVFAKCLNCQKGDVPQSEPCNECGACEDIKAGRHIEFLEVDAASRTGVDDMRDLLESVQYKPVNAKYKIYLIDEVHMLSKSSFNALLKTLEEPPPHVMFLMATTEVEKVPKTVLSRCLQLNLKIIPEHQILEHLRSLLDIEKIKYDEESLALIANSAQGSIRDGLTLLDQAIAHGNGKLKSDQVKELLGTIDQSYVIELIKHIADSDGDKAYLALNKITELNVEYEQVLKIIISVFHKVTLQQQLQNIEDASIKHLADVIDPQVIQLHYEIALNALSKFHVHPHPKQALELCVLRMLAFQPLSDAAAQKIEKKNPKLVSQSLSTKDDVVQADESNRDISQPRAKQIPEASSQDGVAMNSSMPADIDIHTWNSTFHSLNLSMFVSQVFSEFEFVSLKDNILTLKKSDEFINPTENLKTEFLEAISSLLEKKITLVIESGEVTMSPAAFDIEMAQNKLNQDKDALMSNATVKDIIDSFGGKIIDESIKKVSS
tara:strand:+ start:1543 stop:3180 length:1638 start_codon:yes stop_codon:yes gene_type:complete